MTIDTESISIDKTFWSVLVVSALFGIIVGGLWYGSWQAVVESGQAISGTVPYESHNAFYQYHMKAWTMAHQITALFLLTGLSAKAVSILVSGVLGALVFVAFTGIVQVLSNRPYFALAAPFTVLSLLGVKDVYFYGVAYPVFMFDTHHSNGIMGRNLSILILILLSTPNRRAGFLVLGLIPAFHVTWGAWTWGVVFCWMVWEKLLTLENLRKFGPWMALGFTITLTSFLYQQFAAREVPVVDSDTQAQYLSSFFENWDFHRTVVSLNTPGMFMGIVTFLVASSWLYSFRGSLSTAATSILRFLTIATLFSIIACVFATVPQILPNVVNMLMIGRFINISIAALPVLILGLMVSRLDQSRFIRFLLGAHFFYLLFNYFFLEFLSSDRFGWYLPHWIEFCLLGTLLVGYALRSRMMQNDERVFPLPPFYFRGIAFVMFCAFLMFGREALQDVRNKKPLIVREISPVLVRASESSGHLITPGGVEIIQLITGRPLLINTGALDQITVTPSSGPEIARVLERVYGIDYFDPPSEITEKRPSALLPNSGRGLWESRSREEWLSVATEFSATQLLAPFDWEIRLTQIVVDDDWALYDLPR
jgi:hypothetical protein